MTFTRCAIAVLVCLVGSAAPAAATPITILIGVFSYDETIPADPFSADSIAVHGFTVVNTTDSDLVDANVVVPLSFSSLTITHTIGATDTQVALADPLAAGSLASGLPGLEFAATTEIASARLEGVVSVGSFLLADGRLFTADSLAFSILLLPLGGATFLMPMDVIGIELSGEATATTAVPEPSTLPPVIAGVALLGVGVMLARRSLHVRPH